MITNVYGPQPLEDKLWLLTSVEEMKKRYPALPWILGGDFNMIKPLMEKKRGNYNTWKGFSCLPELPHQYETGGYGHWQWDFHME